MAFDSLNEFAPLENIADRDPDSTCLIAAMYSELKRIASWHLAGVNGPITLDVTDLAHDAIGRLLKQGVEGLENRAHALAIASMMVRRVLSNHLRDRSADKRGGSIHIRQLINEPGAEPKSKNTISHVDLLSVNIAIDRLEEIDARQAKIVQMKYFGGMTTQEIAEYLSVSKRTVQMEWSYAKLWLARELF